jgi:hypothetical protein
MAASSYQHAQVVQHPCLPQQSPWMHAAARTVALALAVAVGAGGQTSDVVVAAPAALASTNRKTAKRRIAIGRLPESGTRQRLSTNPIAQMLR